MYGDIMSTGKGVSVSLSWSPDGQLLAIVVCREVEKATGIIRSEIYCSIQVRRVIDGTIVWKDKL